MIEIERKFLVTHNDYRKEASKKSSITQGYLNSDPERTVRIRLKDQVGFITVKGKSNNSGLSRFEWEKEISKTDAEALLKLCEDHVINKIRYEVIVGKHVFEIDEFLGPTKAWLWQKLSLVLKTKSSPNPIGSDRRSQAT